MQKGFTYIELIIVLTVIGILIALGSTQFANVRQNSLDQRRQTDLEEIRGALEQYRTVHNAYPTPTGTYGMPFGTGTLEEGGNTYMQLIPDDPQAPAHQYYYTTSGNDYTLAAELIEEDAPVCSSPPGGDSCGTGNACNYCLGSYGRK